MRSVWVFKECMHVFKQHDYCPCDPDKEYKKAEEADKKNQDHSFKLAA